jgi:RimJ/RimL family protein N-acetyltransferase
MWADADVTPFIGGVAVPAASEVWLRLLRYAGHWSLLGFGFWAVRERARGASSASRLRGHAPRHPARLRRRAEVGWALASWAHGRGFATEAVRAALAWGEANLESPRTVCMIEPANRPSLRVAAKCGYAR